VEDIKPSLTRRTNTW